MNRSVPAGARASTSAGDPRPGASRDVRGRAAIGDIFLARLADLERRVEHELGRSSAGSGPVGAFAIDVVRELWRSGASVAGTAGGLGGLLASWTAGGEVDDLGLDPGLAETVREIVRPLARRWLAVRESRSVPLPDRGGVLVMLNRSAWPLPIEAVVLSAFLGDGRLGGRRLAVLWDREPPEMPWISDVLRRIGVVAATAANAAALLERGAVVVAFPEGSAAGAKTYDRRYRLARFESADMIEAALAAGARIVPGAVVGTEESWPLLGRVAGLPLTAQFPLLGPLGILPLPLAWTIRLGASVEHATDGSGPGAAALADAVRARMQALLGELLSQRGSIVGG